LPESNAIQSCGWLELSEQGFQANEKRHLAFTNTANKSTLFGFTRKTAAIEEEKREYSGG
jgi:hypothetical protein